MAQDWRLQGQARYLQGAVLRWEAYAPYREDWDHDHCAFCSAKFAEADLIPGALHEGYATLDHYHWICETCFIDFKERFAWRVVEGGDEA
jgi:hypothetical protein